MKRLVCCSSLLLVLCHAGVVLAGGTFNTGKIAGTVVDQATGGPLPGVNVVVVGTPYGAATDADGAYFIIGVPPGTYTLRASMVGFREVVATDVRVQSDLTTRIDFTLEEALFSGEEVVVTASRPVVQKDETSSVQYLDIQRLTQLPVVSAREGLFVQTGVFFDPEPVMGGLGGSGRGEARYAVRGGDQTQVRWFLDGVRTAALIEGRADQGGSFTQINLHAMQELQIVTGGFNAEYGDAQSGIVNIVTKEGGPRASASFEYLHGFSGQRHFGNYLYDPATQKEFIDHTLPDGTLDPAWWTPERQSQVYDYRDRSDDHVYATLGGPLFTAGQTSATFFVASQLKREAYVYPRPRDHRTLGDVLANAVFWLRPNMKLRLEGLYSRTGHSTLQENGDFTGQVKYYRGWGSLFDNTSYLGAAHWTHTLTPRLYYELKLSQYLLDLREQPSAFARLGKSDNATLFGFQRYNGYPDEPFDAYTFLYDQHQQAGDLSLTGSLNAQVNNANFVKAGFEARYNTYRELRGYRYPSFSTDPDAWLNRGLHETYHPLQAAAYVQDKMEFKSMILNVGLRYDYFNPNRDWFTTRDLFNLSVDPAYDRTQDPDGDQVDAQGRVKYSFENVLAKPRAPVRSYHMVSPRLGVSFPITDQTKMHFSYGHFYQMPPLDRLFDFAYFRPEYIVEAMQKEAAAAQAEGREPRHIASRDGDPERVVSLSLEPLKPAKTVSFEVGVEHNFGDIVVLDVTGFYKDVFDQTLPRVGLFDRTVYMYDPFQGQTSPNIGFSTNLSGDYGDARGFEITLRTLFSRVFVLDANYSFSRSTEGRATPGRIRYDADGNPTFLYDQDVAKRLPIEKNFSRPHVLRANLFARYPEGGRGVLGTALGGTSASLLFRYVSGRTFTYLGPDDPPDTHDNYRLPAMHTVDLRLEKSFALPGDHTLALYANVTNLLNTKNLRSFGDVVFDAQAVRRYVEEGQITTVDAGGYDISWQTYFPPRQVYVGLRYNLR